MHYSETVTFTPEPMSLKAFTGFSVMAAIIHDITPSTNTKPNTNAKSCVMFRITPKPAATNVPPHIEMPLEIAKTLPRMCGGKFTVMNVATRGHARFSRKPMRKKNTAVIDIELCVTAHSARRPPHQRPRKRVW